jgi:hypothetical protein
MQVFTHRLYSSPGPPGAVFLQGVKERSQPPSFVIEAHYLLPVLLKQGWKENMNRNQPSARRFRGGAILPLCLALARLCRQIRVDWRAFVS